MYYYIDANDKVPFVMESCIAHNHTTKNIIDYVDYKKNPLKLTCTRLMTSFMYVVKCVYV